MADMLSSNDSPVTDDPIVGNRQVCGKSGHLLSPKMAIPISVMQCVAVCSAACKPSVGACTMMCRQCHICASVTEGYGPDGHPSQTDSHPSRPVYL